MNYFKIAWRNIWRNKRRTIITSAAVVVAVFVSTIITSMQEGTYVKMIDNIVKLYTGYIQIQNKDYWEYKTINESFERDSNIYRVINSIKLVSNYTERLEYFSLYSTGNNTRGGLLVGINPEKENSITNLSFWVKEGEYITKNDSGILLGENIAKSLNAKIGDTIILISQGYQGSSAAGLFVLKGIIKYPNPQLNNMGFIDINKAQEFFNAENRLTSIVLMVRNQYDVDLLKCNLQKLLSNNFRIMTWKEMQPELVQMIESDRVSNGVMKVIFYVVVGFGILGTIIMMMAERRREMAIMIAIGMKKIKLIIIVLVEIFFIAFIGIVVGFLISLPIVAYLTYFPVKLTGEIAKAYEIYGLEPKLFFSMDFSVFWFQILVVIVIVMLVSIYPIYNIHKLNVIKGLRN